MSAIAKLSTGVRGLDDLLYGGIPEERATLVTGRSGTGKTVLGLQIAAHLAARGMTTIVVAVEETAEDLAQNGDSLGLRVSDHLAAGRIVFADITRLDGSTLVSGDYDLEGLSHRLDALVERTGARALILDSATALFSPVPPPEALRSHFLALVSTLRRLRLTSIVLSEAPDDYGPLTTLGVEEYVCDASIVLRNVVDGNRRRRSVEVLKYRRSPHYKGEYPCTIATNGLAVFPADPQEHPIGSSVQRFSSGIPGLDEMTHGGWVRSSIIIVRGRTGSGKTLLAGLHARAAAGRGERVVYYGFEETRAILLRNYREIGMDMEPCITSGHLRIICRYPEATSLEDLLVDLRVELEQLRPSLIVMDSLSSIEHSASPNSFRQFVIGVAAILREHGRTALLTQTVSAPELIDDRNAAYLSTIADAILSLDYSVSGNEMQRELRVIKTRGSRHEAQPYRLSIEAGGPVVTRMPAPAAAQGRNPATRARTAPSSIPAHR